jgi:hypothetical protein
MKTAKYPISLVTIFIWIGFVCSISFMEAWLKFRAPNVTLSIGLSIGQLIFAALNKVEWAFAILLIIITLFGGKITKSIPLYLIVLILIIQTYLLLPILNKRADMISQGMIIPRSLSHFYYLFLEVTKVTLLFIIGINIINHLLKPIDLSIKKESDMRKS